MRFIARYRRALLLTAVATAAFMFGCGGDSGTNPGTASGGDGSYEFVTINGQKWTKNNLNIATEDSRCYDADAANCGKYGRLYTWEAAKTACQSAGGRLPDTADWRRLIDYAGGKAAAGKKLKSASGWHGFNGTDAYGFSALPGGAKGPAGSGVVFVEAGNIGIWWAAAADGGDRAYCLGLGGDGDDAGAGAVPKSSGLSARCVAD